MTIPTVRQISGYNADSTGLHVRLVYRNRLPGGKRREHMRNGVNDTSIKRYWESITQTKMLPNGHGFQQWPGVELVCELDSGLRAAYNMPEFSVRPSSKLPSGASVSCH